MKYSREKGIKKNKNETKKDFKKDPVLKDLYKIDFDEIDAAYAAGIDAAELNEAMLKIAWVVIRG